MVYFYSCISKERFFIQFCNWKLFFISAFFCFFLEDCFRITTNMAQSDWHKEFLVGQSVSNTHTHTAWCLQRDKVKKDPWYKWTQKNAMQCNEIIWVLDSKTFMYHTKHLCNLQLHCFTSRCPTRWSVSQSAGKR